MSERLRSRTDPQVHRDVLPDILAGYQIGYEKHPEWDKLCHTT
jgi:hypothetical protein